MTQLLWNIRNEFSDVGKVMMAFILATDFDFIAYMSKMAYFLEAFLTPMVFLEYDLLFYIHLEVIRIFPSKEVY